MGHWRRAEDRGPNKTKNKILLTQWRRVLDYISCIESTEGSPDFRPTSLMFIMCLAQEKYRNEHDINSWAIINAHFVLQCRTALNRAASLSERHEWKTDLTDYVLYSTSGSAETIFWRRLL